MELENAGTATQLLDAICDASAAAIDRKDIRWGQEQRHDCNFPDDYRVVIQIPVGATLFNWFFNGRTEYRAHFRAGVECGLRFNNEIIKALRQLFDGKMNHEIHGRRIIGRFEDGGQVKFPKAFAMTSLSPELSKISYCTKLIGRNEVSPLPQDFFLYPAKILLKNQKWTALLQDDADAWLNVFGAFVGQDGRTYQPKDPFIRAKMLHDNGTT